MKTNLILMAGVGSLLCLLACNPQPASSTSSQSSSNPAYDSLTIELQNIQSQHILPGFAVSIFTEDSILYQNGFSYANVEQKEAYTVDRVQIIASMTKTLVGIALMKTVEMGKLTLDEEVNTILPYPVTNPHYPHVPITIRHLATHTSTIGDTKYSDSGYRFEQPLRIEDFSEDYINLLPHYNQTTSISMDDFLKKKLHPDGQWYEAEVFLEEHPGRIYEYSNLGITLLAYIIELKTGESFADFTQRLILDPLKMEASTWDLAKVDATQEVVYYNEFNKQVPRYRIITYPDGGLYSSVADMTKYLQEIMRGYRGESDLILPAAAYLEMMRKQFPGESLTEGLCWDLSFPGLVGHGGNDFGTSTLMYFSPKTGVGRILFANITTEKEAQEDAFYSIYNLLFKY